ncbi:MAG: IMPACT family protein [Bacteroidales bacterium]|nr:IMPACT family protein [Bacteroidales bacterium]
MTVKDNVYRTIATPAEGQYKDKGSRFLAFAFPVDKEEQIQTILQRIREQYRDARHHCYAYAIGYRREKYRYNDDGEPTGTAGKPIYGQILSFDITNVLIVVVRYFGGTLLGTGGLIQAYKTAAGEALKNALIVEKMIEIEIKITFEYSHTNRIKYILKLYQANVITQLYDEKCEIICKIGLSQFDELSYQLRQMENVIISRLDK